MDLRNPVILGACPLSAHEKSVLRYADAGCGAIVLKTATSAPIIGNPQPWIVKAGDGILYSSPGLPNPGITKFVDRVRRIKKCMKDGPPIVGSVAGSTIEEHCVLATQLEESGVDAIELDLACPNVPGKLLGVHWLENLEDVAKIVKTTKEVLSVPLWIKFGLGSPGVTSPLQLTCVAAEAGADSVKLFPIFPCMPINPHTGKPLLGNIVGSMTGRPLKAVGIKYVADVARAVELPIIGSGGVSSGIDVIEYLMAGASATEVVSSLIYEGPKAVKRIVQEIEEFMTEIGYNNLNEITGMSLKWTKNL